MKRKIKAFETLMDLYKEDILLKEKINGVERYANKELRQEYKTLFMVCDILVVLMILANVAAFILTNALAVKAEPNKPILEANSVAAKLHGFKPATEVYSKSKVYGFMIAFLFRGFIYAVIIGYYIYYRFHIIARKELLQKVSAVVLIWGVMLFLDFFNDFGLWIGKLIWGT